MNRIPLTYLLEYSENNEYVRRQILAEAAAAGIKYLVLNEQLIGQIMSDPSFAGIAGKELAEVGIEFKDAHAPFGPALDLNKPDDHNIVEMYQICYLCIAAQMQVDTITMHIGNNHYFPEDSTEVQTDRVCKMLEKLLPEAEKLGITICIENIWMPLNSPDNLLKIKSRFPTDALGFCFDSGHANLMNNGRNHTNSIVREYHDRAGINEIIWEDSALEKMLPHIVNCHLHDNYGDRDQHALPGRGNSDWKNILALLSQAPRLKVMQSEVLLKRNPVSIKELTECFRQLVK